MAYVTDKDFRKLAEAVADDLMQRQVSLNESIAKLASEMDMNEEQVRRLCEASNNATFNKLFKNKEQDKTASDRLVEFDVADYKKVLGHQIKDASQTVASEKTAAYYELRSLDDEDMHRTRDRVPDAPFAKTAFELRPESVERPEVTRRTALKTLDHLRHEKIAAEMEYHDTLSGLRSRFRRVYDAPTFTNFEKEAAALFGKEAAPHLSALRGMLKMPEVTYNYEVLSKTAGLVDDTTPEMTLFANLVKVANRAVAITKGIRKLEGAL
jgi:AraC-like DNA-binding protein